MADPLRLKPLDPDAALFLDFDGTLAPLQDDPDAVALPNGGAAVLLALADKLGGALAMVSGRDVRDLTERTPLGLWRAGSHGLEICGPSEAPAEKQIQAPSALLVAIEAICADHPGTRMEPKGGVIAIHYRAAPEAKDILAAALHALIDKEPGYRLQSGKMVFEAKPDSANKGVAVRTLMQAIPFKGRKPVFIGDDATDEDAMAVVLELDGIAIKVGDGETVAPHRLENSEEVWQWLKASR